MTKSHADNWFIIKPKFQKTSHSRINTKMQAPNFKQFPILEILNINYEKFGYWNLGIVWLLLFVILNMFGFNRMGFILYA